MMVMVILMMVLMTLTPVIHHSIACTLDVSDVSSASLICRKPFPDSDPSNAADADKDKDYDGDGDVDDD